MEEMICRRVSSEDEAVRECGTDMGYKVSIEAGL